MDKQALLKSIQNHDSAASLSLAINDFVASYQSYLAASIEAKTIADNEIDKKVSEKYLTLSEEYASKANAAVANLHLSRDAIDKITPRKPTKGFDSFVGNEETKAFLKEELVKPWLEGKFHERELHSLLVYGPEKNGKSVLITSICYELGATPYYIQPFQSFSIYNKDNAIEHMKRIFALAEQKNNIVFYFPEPIAFFPKEDNDMNKKITKLFLKLIVKEMKRIKKLKLNILFIADTSAPDKLSMKLFKPGLFDDFIRIHHPNHKTRYGIIEERTRDVEITDETIEYMVKLSKTFIAKDISRMIRQCKKFAGLYQGDKEKPVIDQVIVDKVMSDFEPDNTDIDFNKTIVPFEEAVKGKVHIFNSTI